MPVKVYIAGPMTGFPDHNFPAFFDAEAKLKELGFEVVNPASFGECPELNWVACLKRDLPLMWECNAVIALDQCWRSKGARLEQHVANELGIAVIDLEDMMSDPEHYRDRIYKSMEALNGIEE